MWIQLICLHILLVSASFAAEHESDIINGRNWQEYVSEPSAMHFQLPDEILRRFQVAYHGDYDDLEQVKLWLKVDSAGSSKFLFKELLQLGEDDSDDCEWSLINFARTFLPKLDEDKHLNSPASFYFRHFGKQKFGRCALKFAREFQHEDKYIFEWIMDKFIKAAYKLGKEASEDKLYEHARKFHLNAPAAREPAAYKVAFGYGKLLKSNGLRTIMQGEEAVIGMYTKWRLNRAISQPVPQNLDKDKILGDFLSDICATLSSKHCDGLDTLNIATVLGFKSGELQQKRLLKLNEYSRVCLSWSPK